MDRSYYEILKVSPDASFDEIKAAYRALASKYHPDRNRESPSAANRLMQEINAAHAVLSDPEQRRIYDEQLRSAPTQPADNWRETVPNEYYQSTREHTEAQEPAATSDVGTRLANGAIAGTVSKAFKLTAGLLAYGLIQQLLWSKHQLSSVVISFQFLILLSMILGGMLLGFRVLKLLTAAWFAWTLFYVFTTWLSILQLTTIGMSYLIALNLLNCAQFRTVRRVVVGGLTTVVIGIGVLVLLEEGRSRSYSATSAGVTEPSTFQPSSSRTAPGFTAQLPKSDEELFVETVNRLEAKFPMLNPESPRFDSRAVDRVLALTRSNVARGMKRHEALEQAARRVMSDPNPATGTVYRCKNNVYQDVPCAQDARQ